MVDDPGNHTVAELRDAIDDIDDAGELEALLDAERDGKDRKTAKEAIESRLDEVGSTGTAASVAEDVEATTEEIQETIREELGSVNDRVLDTLSRFLKTPQRANVYVHTIGDGIKKGDIPDETGLNADRVDEILDDLTDEGLVEHAGGGVYSAVQPSDALRNFRDRLNEIIESETEERVSGRKEFNPPGIPYRVIFETKEDEKVTGDGR